MEKQKFKLTNSIQASLLERSRKLPSVCRTDSDGQPLTRIAQVPGSRLKQEDLKAGQVLNPHGIYRVKEYVLVDHYKTMREIYQEKGPDEVKDYEDATLALERYTNTKMKLSWVEMAKNWLNNLIK